MRRGNGVVRTAKRDKPWCQRGKLEDIKFPKHFYVKPQRKCAIYTPVDLLNNPENYGIEMPEKKLLVAIVNNAWADYSRLPKHKWTAERTKAYLTNGVKRERALERIQVSRIAWEWLTSRSEAAWSYKWIASLTDLPADINKLIPSL